jgi:hypothetical protein
MPVMDGPTANLAAVLSGIAAPFAMAGVGLARPDAPPAFHIATAPGISADEHSLFRAASISKSLIQNYLSIINPLRDGV